MLKVKYEEHKIIKTKEVFYGSFPDLFLNTCILLNKSLYLPVSFVQEIIKVSTVNFKIADPDPNTLSISPGLDDGEDVMWRQQVQARHLPWANHCVRLTRPCLPVRKTGCTSSTGNIQGLLVHCYHHWWCLRKWLHSTNMSFKLIDNIKYNFSQCLPFKYTVDKRPGCSNVHIFIAAGFIKHFVKNEFMLK